MRRLWFLLVCLACLGPASAGAATWYVTNAGSGVADGSSYAKAFAGWAGINFASIVAGDTLVVCGKVTSATDMHWDKLGTVNAHITLTGVCPEEGGQTGILDGNGTAEEVLSIEDVSNSSYTDVTYLTVQNSAQNATADCLFVSFTVQGTGPILIDHVTLKHCGQEGAWLFRPNITLQNSVISDIGEDGVNVGSTATDVILQDNTISNFSTIATTGDGVECQIILAGNITIRRNTILFNNMRSTKQAIVCGNVAGSGTVLYEQNIITAPVPTAVNGGISHSAGTGIVRGNRVTGFSNCITVFNTTAQVFGAVSVYGNALSNCALSAVRFSVTVGTAPVFYVYNNTGSDVNNGMSASITVASSLSHYNNSWNLKAGSTGFALFIGANITYTGNGNIYRPEGTNYLSNAGCGASTWSTLAAYKSACAQEAGSLTINPLLVSTTDLRTTSNSPARRAGTPTTLCGDARGRPCWNPPDIGAYQSSSGDPAATRAVRIP